MKLHDLGVIDPRTVPGSAEEWLDVLPGAVAFRLPGRDRTRWRAVVGMLHGNEPSGFRAIHAILRDGVQPATNVLFVVAAIDSARLAPRFSHRMAPGRRDLNRAFGQTPVDEDTRLAQSIFEAVVAAEPEAMLDLHNNTGHNPPYAVGSSVGPRQLDLAALFAHRFVLARFRLGTLIEAVDPRMPAVTIECGRAGEAAADEAAREGLVSFLECNDLWADRPRRSMVVLGEPVRVMVAPGFDVAFSNHRETEARLTFDEDVDRHNFVMLPAGTRVGWVSGGELPVFAVNESGHDVTSEYFHIEGDALVTLRSFMPIMMTTNTTIALHDCLFYAVEPIEV